MEGQPESLLKRKNTSNFFMKPILVILFWVNAFCLFAEFSDFCGNRIFLDGDLSEDAQVLSSRKKRSYHLRAADSPKACLEQIKEISSLLLGRRILFEDFCKIGVYKHRFAQLDIEQKSHLLLEIGICLNQAKFRVIVPELTECYAKIVGDILCTSDVNLTFPRSLTNHPKQKVLKVEFDKYKEVRERAVTLRTIHYVKFGAFERALKLIHGENKQEAFRLYALSGLYKREEFQCGRFFIREKEIRKYNATNSISESTTLGRKEDLSASETLLLEDGPVSDSEQNRVFVYVGILTLLFGGFFLWRKLRSRRKKT